jgi:hypothetical protein
VPSDIQTVIFTIKAIADGGTELISSVKKVITWKWIPEYPLFRDPLAEWKIKLSSNSSYNNQIAEYRSIQAIDYQEDRIVSSFNFNDLEFLSGISNSTDGTFTLYANITKMSLNEKQFYVYITLKDDKDNISPISYQVKVIISIKN